MARDNRLHHRGIRLDIFDDRRPRFDDHGPQKDSLLCLPHLHIRLHPDGRGVGKVVSLHWPLRRGSCHRTRLDGGTDAHCGNGSFECSRHAGDDEQPLHHIRPGGRVRHGRSRRPPVQRVLRLAPDAGHRGRARRLPSRRTRPVDARVPSLAHSAGLRRGGEKSTRLPQRGRSKHRK